MAHRLLTGLLLVATSFGPAMADLREDCQGGRWPDFRLEACSEIILSSDFGPGAKAFAYRSRGEARNEAGAYRQAIFDFSEAIRLKPDDAWAFAGRGWARFSIKDVSASISDFDEAIRLSPTTADLYIERGHVNLASGNASASVRDLNEAIRLNSHSASAYNNRGLALRKNGDLDGALRDYSRAIAINPVYALAYENRGYVQEARGQKNAAIEDLRHALLLDPSLVDAMTALRRLGAGQSIARESDKRIREGKALVEINCSRCHAVGAQGGSPNHRAPEFRNLRRLHTLVSLREPITRGIAAPHAQMPQFQLSNDQIDTVVAYINGLAMPSK